VERDLRAFLTLALGGGESSATLPGRFYLGVSLWYPLVSWADETQKNTNFVGV
jgi:hypothetical protein